eukprot:c14390_g1_i2.p1 GENE.c14390_g1_i2~~c14390_g1_i2.p1  ORF type:complete len:253 (+),score=64.95 c14390_g1_i2:29-760(+)
MPTEPKYSHEFSKQINNSFVEVADLYSFCRTTSVNDCSSPKYSSSSCTSSPSNEPISSQTQTVFFSSLEESENCSVSSQNHSALFETVPMKIAKLRFESKIISVRQQIIQQGVSEEESFHLVIQQLQQKSPAINNKEAASMKENQNEKSVQELEYVNARTGFSKSLCLDVLALRNEIQRMRTESCPYSSILDTFASRLDLTTKYNSTSTPKNLVRNDVEINDQHIRKRTKHWFVIDKLFFPFF